MNAIYHQVVRLITRTHMLLYRLSGGVVGGLIAGVPNLLLTTTGHRSGKQHTTPLFYLPHGVDFVVVASYGGNPKDPAWWQNLKANPRGFVRVGPHHWPIQAEQASEELKQQLWPIFCRYYPGYLDYQAKTERSIPLVILKS